MPRPYNKKTITDALVLCQMMASNPKWSRASIIGDIEEYISPSTMAEHLGIPKASTGYSLAVNAYYAVVGKNVLGAVAWAEAEGLIRDGWRNGDPVELTTKQLELPLANPADADHYTFHEPRELTAEDLGLGTYKPEDTGDRPFGTLIVTSVDTEAGTITLENVDTIAQSHINPSASLLAQVDPPASLLSEEFGDFVEETLSSDDPYYNPEADDKETT